jgi:ferredoxin
MNSETKFLEGDWRQKLLDALSGNGYTVLAPVLDGDVTRFRPCSSAAEIVQDRVNTHYPLKEAFLPMTEAFLEYRYRPGEDLTYSSQDSAGEKIAILGSRPCDAASLGIIDAVFNWDYEDTLYNNRRDRSIIISVVCIESDERCFCTSVGLGPQSCDGSDILIKAGNEGAAVEICSEKGRAFVEAHRELFAEVPDDFSVPVAEVPVRFDLERIKPWLDDNFNADFWEFIALRCLGCGACSYLCPTCHCFDVIDEANWQGGERRRNYDSCSYALFTLHASGHNPRPTQEARYRNRIMHKFHYFVERFERTACVGCGRCMRICGVGQNLIDILRNIELQSREKTAAES